jgi:hypothetical protein
VTAWCQSCGASDLLTSRRAHEQACRAGVPVVWTDINPHTQAKAQPVTHTSVTHETVTPASVTHTERSKDAERQARYRERHGAAYRERHRDLMRKVRATEKTASPA